jgi:hypothetical protein
MERYLSAVWEMDNICSRLPGGKDDAGGESIKTFKKNPPSIVLTLIQIDALDGRDYHARNS